VVITAAGMMLHSLWSLSQVNPGFRTDRIVTAEVSMDANACKATPATAAGAAIPSGRCAAFYSALLDRLHGVAGMEDVALADALPLTAREGNYVYDAEGHPREAREGALLATGRIVTPEYFATLDVNLMRGRLLDAQDAAGASRAVVISEKMAEKLWPNENPLGRHLLAVRDELAPAAWNEKAAVNVVGIVSNTHDASLSGGVGDDVYLPLTPGREQPVMYVLLRTRATTEVAAGELREAVAAISPEVPVTRVRTLDEVVASSQSASRSLTILLLAFGGLAVVIGGVGVYSLIAYIVSWRTREIGIRLALGAQRWQIVHGVVRQSLVLALGGSAAGLAAAALVGQLLRSFLFGVKPVDPVTFCAVPVLMTVLALMAAWIPARRAASVDPMKTLRME
jgi:predicted permease